MKHQDFRIGIHFRTGFGLWRCTDVGTRTAAAIKIKGPGAQEDPSWFNGPPYAVQEVVFDENDFPGCTLEE